ncbi:30S ribosomal protein S21 [Patescibacteria group bacterium]
MVDVKRKKGESFESLLRRFSRRVQDSGKILQARKIRFHANASSKNALKAKALRREELREKREYLIKSGQATEEDFRRRKGRRRR